MKELMHIDSPLASKKSSEVLCGDRKDYTDGQFRFALAQVEESDFELLHERYDELAMTIKEFLTTDNLDFFGLLVTDAVRENSQLLAIGSAGIVGNLPYSIGNILWSQYIPMVGDVIRSQQHTFKHTVRGAYVQQLVLYLFFESIEKSYIHVG